MSWREWLDEVSMDIHTAEGRKLVEGFKQLAEAVEARGSQNTLLLAYETAMAGGGDGLADFEDIRKRLLSAVDNADKANATALAFLRGVGGE